MSAMTNKRINNKKEKEVKTTLEQMRRRRKLKENLVAHLVISPWLIGFFGLTLGPIIMSLYFSFTTYNIISAPRWIGWENYVTALTSDPRFWNSVQRTFMFVFISVPLRLAIALMLAQIFRVRRKGTALFTTVYYIPSIIGGSVAIAVVWRQLFGRTGAINALLSLFNFPGMFDGTYSWLASPQMAIWTLIILSLWQFGSPMIIFLAGLRQIPAELYEAAEIDGASKRRKFISITLPLLSPVIFFNLVMQLIGGFMVFNSGFLITRGGPIGSTTFYSIYLYEMAFEVFRMGYASAIAWILLIIIGTMTGLVFWSQKHWVHYTGD